MSNGRALEMIKKLTRDGGLLDYGPDRSRLLVRVIRTLARGEPVSGEQVNRFIAELRVSPAEAQAFLMGVTERDHRDNIVGAFGLSLNQTRHRFSVDGADMFTWCAEDTLFLPGLLGRTATVESPSPVSGEKVQLRVSPEKVEHSSPAGTVVSIAIVDPDRADMSSVAAIWTTFCHHIHLFGSLEEAKRWAAGRDDLDLISVEQGFQVGKILSNGLLSYVNNV